MVAEKILSGAAMDLDQLAGTNFLGRKHKDRHSLYTNQQRVTPCF